MATCLNPPTNAATDFEATCFLWPNPFPGIVVASPTPPGGLRPAQHRLGISASDLLRRVNALLAQVPSTDWQANLLTDQAWSLEGCRTGTVVDRGRWHWLPGAWTVAGPRLPQAASPAFGLGASLRWSTAAWAKVPLALPLRTGLSRSEAPAPRPNRPGSANNSCPQQPGARKLELASWSARWGPLPLLLQYYQGTRKGLCGWEGLNDLASPLAERPHHTDGAVILDCPLRWRGAAGADSTLLAVAGLSLH